MCYLRNRGGFLLEQRCS